MINVRDFRVDRNSTSTAPVSVIERTNDNNQTNLAKHPRQPLLCLNNFPSYIESRYLPLRFVNRCSALYGPQPVVYTAF